VILEAFIKAKSLGHGLPDEIILFKTPEIYCRRVFVRENNRKIIIIASVDPTNVDSQKYRKRNTIHAVVRQT
jgi:hypothetical protein